MLLSCLFLLVVQVVQVFSSIVVYSEIQPHLQKYQDFGLGFPDFGEWILMYRNFRGDISFGDEVKGLKNQKYGRNTKHRSEIVITYQTDVKVRGRLTIDSSEGYTARNVVRLDFCQSNYTIETHVIFWEPYNCLIMRHRYVANGFGCTYWRHIDALNKPDHCCQFIYDENCGTVPKYKTSDPRCPPGSKC